MKTLYISDMDGTLLSKQAELSEYSINGLNTLLTQGMHFTVATARTIATVAPLLAKVAIDLPVILMNGVAIYDLAEKRYINFYEIKPTAVDFLLKTLKKHDIYGFLYKIVDNEMLPLYERITSNHMQQFMDERKQKFNKRFQQIGNFQNLSRDAVIYFSVCDKEEHLRDFYEEIVRNPELHTEFYRDIYSADYWFLEISSPQASKYHAVEFLKKQYGFDQIISFGDNLNDLSMFAGSDRCFAVANAKEQVKAQAEAVIGSNEEDGVVHWLLEHSQLNER